ncbi:MAG: L-threonylcarbamoyladenylate synthase [Pseudomonadota bacterium]
MANGETERLGATEAGIARAVALLRAEDAVAFPTETVYGLGADARSDTAVARIYEAKRRPRFNPLIVHVASPAMAEQYGRLEGSALALAEAFWPGPLTLILPVRSSGGIGDLVTAGLETVGLRVPAAPVARRLLEAFGGPVAAPSANPSGRVSPTTAAHVLEGLEGRIPAVLDGGPCVVGVESTIVECNAVARVLRPGGVPSEALRRVLGDGLVEEGPGHPEQVTAPGQLASHYAPGKPVRLAAEAPRDGEVWLGFGPGRAHRGVNLSRQGDLSEAAAGLFAALRRLDAMDGAGIAVAPIPDVGLGVAINDRLRRAAAPRP